MGQNQNNLKPAFPRHSGAQSLPSKAAKSPPASSNSRSPPKKSEAAGQSVLTSRPKLKVAGLGQLMSGTAKIRTIPSIDKPAEKEWDLVVTAVETTREVWVHPQSSVGILKELEAKMLRRHHSMECFSGGFILTYLECCYNISVRSHASWGLLQC